ncbi:hypothetical protein MJK72_16505 [Klebsiella pneumoniae]|nr:hypothetical protein MJK72_16505 [Klebsiella pneumoniae]
MKKEISRRVQKRGRGSPVLPAFYTWNSLSGDVLNFWADSVDENNDKGLDIESCWRTDLQAVTQLIFTPSAATTPSA